MSSRALVLPDGTAAGVSAMVPVYVMNTRKLLPDRFKDDDTYKVLDIAGHFMEQYFGHTEQQWEALMVGFFAQFGSRFDEDAVHHESSYGMAAIIHGLQHLKCSSNELGHWMLESGLSRPPPEAIEYFREHYFIRYAGSE